MGGACRELRTELMDGGVCDLMVRLLQKGAMLPLAVAAAVHADADASGCSVDECLASLLGGAYNLLLLQGYRGGLALEEPLQQRSVDAFVRASLCEGVYASR